MARKKQYWEMSVDELLNEAKNYNSDNYDTNEISIGTYNTPKKQYWEMSVDELLNEAKNYDEEKALNNLSTSSTTSPQNNEKGFIRSLWENIWDKFQRAGSAIKAGHIQQLKNIDDSIKNRVEKLKTERPNMFSGPVNIHTGEQLPLTPQQTQIIDKEVKKPLNIIYDIASSYVNPKNIEAAKEGWKNKNITGKNVAEQYLDNIGGTDKHPIISKAIELYSDITDDPLTLIPLIGAEKVGGNAMANVGKKYLPKVFSKALPQIALKGGGTGLAYGAMEGLGEGKDLKDTAKLAGERALEFSALGVGGYGAGKAGGKVFDTLKYLVNPELTTKATIADRFISLPGPKNAPGRLEAPSEKLALNDAGVMVGDEAGNVFSANNVSKPVRLYESLTNDELAMAGRFYQNKFKTTGDPQALEALKGINNEIKMRLREPYKYTASIEDTSVKELNDAIEAIQEEIAMRQKASYSNQPFNPTLSQKYPNSIPRVARDLGIDLPGIINKANTPLSLSDNLRKIAERNKMAQVVGIAPQRNIRLTKPTNIGVPNEFEIPQVEAKPQSVSEVAKEEIAKSAEQAAPGGLPGLAKEATEQVTMKGKPSRIKDDALQDFIKEYGLDPRNIKDSSGFKYFTTDVYRNFEDVFGNNPAIKEKILNPLDTAKKSNIEMQKQWTDRLYKEVVQGLGIKKGSVESKLVQDFGEGKITLDELKAQRPNDWQKIVEADKWFRSAYNDILDQVNAVRAQIYPTNPAKQVPKRKNYYRHFRELEGLEGLKNLFETPANIDPNLVGISEFTQPKSKFHGFMQKRGLGPYKSDAVGGFLNYIPNASYAINIDPQIMAFRQFGGKLAKATTETKNANNFIQFIREYANDLSGKTNPMDRFLQDKIPGGRKTFNVLRWANNRVKSNTVLGNVSSALSQFANVPQGVAFAKEYSIPGATRTIKSILSENIPAKQSGFLAERYGGPGSAMYSRFDTNFLNQPKKMLAWLLETTDKIGTNFIWNSTYEKGLAEGVANPIKYADDATRKLVAGRGIGEIPLYQKSTITQFVAPFTLEVGNSWKVMKDFVSAKDFGAIATLLLANYIFNRGLEKIKGSGIVFDPIQALIDAFSEKDISPLQRVGRIAGEFVSNVPLGQSIASVYPENGLDIMGVQLPTRKEFFGKNDPTRYGTGPILVKAIQEPLTSLALPYGGKQAKKTLEGTKTIVKGGAYTDKGELKYPVQESPSNMLKAALFGTSSLPETKDYYDNNRRPLSEKQTAQFEKAVNAGIKPSDIYKEIMKERIEDGAKIKAGKIKKDKSLTLAQKKKNLQELYEKTRREIDRLKMVK